MTKELILSQDKVALVDDKDHEWASQWKWSAMVLGKRVYAVRAGKILSGGRITIYLHREILKAPIGVDVDHINGDGLDNRRSNLRLATRSENMGNRPMQANNSSGFKGVTWNKKLNKWQAQIKGRGRSITLGCFDNLEEAALIYDEAARKYFGEFARLNFPEVGGI